MIINVFGNWLEPTGIRLEPFEYVDEKGTFILFGYTSATQEYYDPARGTREGVVSQKHGIYIYDKTVDEVATEINKQIRETIQPPTV